MRYKKSGWIQSFGRGAYILYGDKVEWPGALYALQTQLGLYVHPGGKTALELKGYAHYLPSGKRKVFLYGTQGRVLPSWFKGEGLVCLPLRRGRAGREGVELRESESISSFASIAIRSLG